MKKIFIFGQCTMHWGRMEFGNIGNYYITKPMFEQFRRVFPDAEISTTMQFSKAFTDRFDVRTVPMEAYYDFNPGAMNLENAQREYEAVKTGTSINSLFVEELKYADLAIDFSGDIWGDNADFLGTDRFMTGLYKDLTAQQLCRTIMIAGSPGPFNAQKDVELIKRTFENFSFVSNREPVSTRKLRDMGFNMTHVHDYACPSFLFKGMPKNQLKCIEPKIFETDKLKIGIMLCGWNFEQAPYGKWPREDCEYDKFVAMAKKLVDKFDAKIFLMSHSNGFDVPPAPFKLKQGRDFPIMEQFSRILNDKENVILLDGVYTPEETKGIISNFDFLISGRMHGAVSGISQCIPTVILDYGHEPKAHKSRGFAEVVGAERIIVDPANLNEMLTVTEERVKNRIKLKEYLVNKIPEVQESARKQFDVISKLA